MENKNLPIKFFQKRQKDEMGTEAGGGQTIPKWASEGQLREKSEYIKTVLANVSSSLAEKVKKNNYIPSVVKLKVSGDALAKTYRKEIGNLFNVGKLNIIGVSGEDEVLIKIDNEADLKNILNRFSDAKLAFPNYTTLVGISAINNIEEFKPQIEIEEENEEQVYKVKLFNYGNTDLNNILIRSFEKYCRENNIDFEKAEYSEELNIFRISKVTTDDFEELRDFDGIQLITEMPTYSLTLDELTEENVIEIKQPKEGANYPVVGVLDTGIANIPHLTPWLHNKSFSKYHEDYINKGHGTFVAGVLLYGDNLEGKDYTGFEGCKLFEAIVMPDLNKQKIFEDELIENIREAITDHNEIKIWNLSLGTDREADLYEFSDFAKALDEIQEENNVLICKSAGNCNNFKINAPKSRIAKSADTVRGLVVGSIAHDKLETDYAEKNNLSPFSRIGPGPSNLIKPDVVHFGGNAGLDTANKLVINPVKSFSPDGSLAKQVGTSFSTPRIAAITAGVH
jgi:hypothetical protein